MNNLSKIITAFVLALSVALILPAQVFADSVPEYISEVKVYEGNFDEAGSKGYIILCGDDGEPVDLNQGSGSKDISAKGNKKVYLGYKTTTKRAEAITDLALMKFEGRLRYGRVRQADGRPDEPSDSSFCRGLIANATDVFPKTGKTRRMRAFSPAHTTSSPMILPAPRRRRISSPPRETI